MFKWQYVKEVLLFIYNFKKVNSINRQVNSKNTILLFIMIDNQTKHIEKYNFL